MCYYRGYHRHCHLTDRLSSNSTALSVQYFHANTYMNRELMVRVCAAWLSLVRLLLLLLLLLSLVVALLVLLGMVVTTVKCCVVGIIR